MSRPRLVVVERPFNAETPLESLGARITPVSEFYVRNHFDVPHLEVGRWKLELGGAVERSLSFSLSELQAMKSRTEVVTLECAGNGRTRMRPQPPGVAWGVGAVGVAEFTGVPLRAVLERAAPRAEASEVLFEGADRGTLASGQLGGYARSLRVEQALAAGPLLAWSMNGEPLTEEHGRPLRLVVPGWYGMASVKWLERVTLLTKAFDGTFQNDYRYVRQAGEPDAPVERIRVRSLITRPRDGDAVSMGTNRVTGIAWTSDGTIRGVDLSFDGGMTWQAARLGTQEAPHAPVHWELDWQPDARGTCTVMARARDSSGFEQPLEPIWNERGYGNNSVHSIRVQTE